PSASIYVLEGAPAGAGRPLRAARLTPVLSSLPQIDAWAADGGGRAVLHIDTGMSRLGLDERDVDTLAAAPARLAGVDIEYVMTHLACADQPTNPMNAEQIGRFDRLRHELPAAPTSIGASAGIFVDA